MLLQCMEHVEELSLDWSWLSHGLPSSRAGRSLVPRRRSRIAPAWSATPTTRCTRPTPPAKAVSLFVDEAKLKAVGPQDQHLRQLPRRYHLASTRTTTSRPSRRTAPSATSSNRRATAPASTAWRWPRAEAGSATCSDCHDGTHDPAAHLARLRRCIFPGWPKPAALATTQAAKDVEESVHGKAVAAGPPRGARPARIAIRNTRSRDSRAAPR